MRINKEILKKLNPCKDRWKNFLEHYPKFSGELKDFLSLENISIDDKFFVIKKVVEIHQLILWSKACVKSCAKFKNHYAEKSRKQCDIVIDSYHAFTKYNMSFLDLNIRVQVYYVANFSALASKYPETQLKKNFDLLCEIVGEL